MLAPRALIQRWPVDDRATVLKYQRSTYTSNAIVFDADLNLHSLEQLRELARDGVQFSIVDVETEEGVTKVLPA